MNTTISCINKSKTLQKLATTAATVANTQNLHTVMHNSQQFNYPPPFSCLFFFIKKHLPCYFTLSPSFLFVTTHQRPSSSPSAWHCWSAWPSHCTSPTSSGRKSTTTTTAAAAALQLDWKCPSEMPMAATTAEAAATV